MTQTTITSIVAAYLAFYPNDRSSLRSLAKQLQDDDENITSRRNFVGHIVTSVFIVDVRQGKALLLKHLKLGLLLTPGGHLDASDETPLDGATRELQEETGLTSSDVSYKPLIADNRLVPFDIDTHSIPPHPDTGEATHYHHDFRYLMTCNKDLQVSLAPAESSGPVWVRLREFSRHQGSGYGRVAKKIEAMIGS
jgi:8-oxo-dGTP pyrophosphatase MutT (NUDIX family)